MKHSTLATESVSAWLGSGSGAGVGVANPNPTPNPNPDPNPNHSPNPNPNPNLGLDLVAQPDQVLLRRRVAQVEALQPHGLTQVVVVARVGASTVDARNAEHEPQLDAWLGGGLGLGLANPNPNPNQVAREGLGLTLTVIRRRVDERLELEVPSAAHICAAVGTHGNAVVFKARDRAEGRGQRGETRGVGALLKRCGAHGATWASSGCPSLSRDRRAWWRTR